MKKNNAGKKLFLKKDIILSLTENEQKMVVGGNFDTPTINDNCDPWASMGAFRCGNTFFVCNPKDWCGYHHESNCEGPLLTDVWLVAPPNGGITYPTIPSRYQNGIPQEEIPTEWYGSGDTAVD